MAEFLIYAAASAGTYFGVRLFVGWSRRRNILDIPNERSSHARPTPRGGGLVIVLVSLSFYLFYALFVARSFSPEYFFGALLVAAISWADDLYSVSFVWRFLIHAVAAFLLVQSLNESLFSAPPFDSAVVKIAGFAAVCLWIVWMTNAYNFMDGIDGIAGAQAIAAGFGWLAIGKILHLETVGVFGGVIAAASLGFLILNWHPAKVFMGDVGSAFLGFSFAALPVLAFRESGSGAAAWISIAVALVWLFFFDTIVTLARRILRRENIWRAHRSHIYQQLTNERRLSHKQTAGLYGGLSALNALTVAAAYVRDEFVFVLYIMLALEAAGLLLFSLRTRAEKREIEIR